MTPAAIDAAAMVLSWLLTYAIHSTILLAAAALVAWRLADRHEWLDLIWKTAVLAPLVTASVQVDVLATPFGGRWAIARATTAGPAAPAAIPDPAPAGPVAAPDAARAVAAEREPTSHVAGPDGGRRSMAAVEPRAASSLSTVLRKWPEFAAGLWLFVALAGVARYGIRLRRVYAAYGSGLASTSADLVDTIDGLRRAARERRVIHLTTSARCPVPLALGGGRIVVPERFMSELDAEQQRAALAHEVAHVVRRDPEWRIALQILERALFFQPLNRLARARLCDSAEFLCDEWAVRQTQSPLALARCLSVVASWWSPAGTLPAGASAMARSDSAMVRRVTRILTEPAPAARGPRLPWLLIPVALVAMAAPRVTATALDTRAPVTATSARSIPEQPAPPRADTPAEIAAARAQLRDYRSTPSGGSLEDRWRQALADAGKERISDLWIMYTFTTPTHAGDTMLADTHEGSFISSNGRFTTKGVPLASLLNPQPVPLEGSRLAVLMHYRGARADAIDRAGYRSLQLGVEFGRTPVFWLGDAPESESFTRVQALFGQARTEKLQTLLIELASLHSNTDVVLPFLTRLLEPSWPAAIRREAAEGFDHHHDPRSVEILLRVARTDADSSVRAEAAETIGEVQTPQSIPALTDLVKTSPDVEVRREAAEAFADQPAAQAIPALEAVIAASDDEDVLGEAVEALGDLGGPAALRLLLQTANAHRNERARLEAVETLGDIDEPGVLDALTKIAWEHADVNVQREAVETIGDRRDDPGSMAALERIVREHPREEVQAEAIETIADRSESSLHPLILELAVSGRTPQVRREALDSIGGSLSKISDAQVLDRAQAVIERVVFDDPDPGVRAEALDTLDELPGDRALRALRNVIARHPDARVRRDAEDHVRDRKQ